MKIIIEGHDYKYAVEQMLLTMFPLEHPEYTEPLSGEDGLKVSLEIVDGKALADCRYIAGGVEYAGADSAVLANPTDALLTDRVCQRAVKNAIYRAVLASGHPQPPWGALTGVRPGKIMCRILSEEKDREAAVKRFSAEYDVSPERAELCCQTALCTQEAERALAPGDICLYVGIPFCPTRCAYCSFVSQSVEKSMKLMPPFLEALKKETDALAETVKSLGMRVVSVYMGGGTPTTLSAEQLRELCGHLEKSFDFSVLKEYTVEAGRPDTITPEKMRVLKEHGITRVSVNPQTMSDEILEVIGRRHTAGDILRALDTVRRAGDFEVNMDLIAGLPKDTEEGFNDTLEKVLALDPENITVHTLSLKKGSGILTGGVVIPSAETVGKMLDTAGSRLSAAGYAPYYLYRQKFMSGGFENTGWAKPGAENLYNICMMEEICSVVALGGGGSTKLVASGNSKNIRLTAPKYPLEYIEGIDRICENKSKIREFFTNV